MFNVTPTAAQELLAAAARSDAAGMALRIAARQIADGSIEYGMGFDDEREDDEPAVFEGLTVLLGSPSRPLLQDTERQLQQYFAGEREHFDLPLDFVGTEFQQKVWGELRRIPYGETASYSEIAARLGYEPVVSRAVGAANGANPIPVVVPCHRVIGSNSTLTGYAGGIERKQILLDLERPGLF